MKNLMGFFTAIAALIGLAVGIFELWGAMLTHSWIINKNGLITVPIIYRNHGIIRQVPIYINVLYMFITNLLLPTVNTPKNNKEYISQLYIVFLMSTTFLFAFPEGQTRTQSDIALVAGIILGAPTLYYCFRILKTLWSIHASKVRALCMLAICCSSILTNVTKLLSFMIPIWLLLPASILILLPGSYIIYWCTRTILIYPTTHKLIQIHNDNRSF